MKRNFFFAFAGQQSSVGACQERTWRISRLPFPLVFDSFQFCEEIFWKNLFSNRTRVMRQNCLVPTFSNYHRRKFTAFDLSYWWTEDQVAEEFIVTQRVRCISSRFSFFLFFPLFFLSPFQFWRVWCAESGCRREPSKIKYGQIIKADRKRTGFVQ